MRGVGLVMLGFVWGVLHDAASYRGTPLVKPAFLILAAGSHVAGAWQLLVRGPRQAVPTALQRVTAVFAVVGFLGMLYSIAIEIPFRKAWIDRGHTGNLVTTGTYSIARHPGVLWTTLWVACAAFATRSRDLIRFWPAVIAADVLHVWIQSRWLLPHVFGDEYRDYQRRVPFLVPRLGRARGRRDD